MIDWIFFTFGIQKFFFHSSVRDESEHSDSGLRALQIGSKTQNPVFFKTIVMILKKF
jgi:hypothetical protein